MEIVTGEVIAVKEKFSRYGSYFGITVRRGDGFVWLKRTRPVQSEQPVRKGQTVTIEGTLGETKGAFTFFEKGARIVAISGDAKPCLHPTLNLQEDGTYLCGGCEEATFVRPLRAEVAA